MVTEMVNRNLKDQPVVTIEVQPYAVQVKIVLEIIRREKNE